MSTAKDELQLFFHLPFQRFFGSARDKAVDLSRPRMQPEA